MSYFETQKKGRVQLGMYFRTTYTWFPVSIIPASYRSIPTFVSNRLSVPIRRLRNQHDYFIGYQPQCLASKSDTSHSVHVFQRAISNFEILFLASISIYKPEISLTVLLARKVFLSALKVEYTSFFIGKFYKQHQFKIFQTNQIELKEKNGKFILKRTLLHRYPHMILDKIHTILYKYIYFYTNLCTINRHFILHRKIQKVSYCKTAYFLRTYRTIEYLIK